MKSLFLIPLIIVLVVGLIFTSCAAPAPSPAPAPATATTSATAPGKLINLAFATANPPMHYLVKEAWEPWVKEVETRTEGRVKVTIYPGGQVCKSTEQFEAVIMGSAVDIAAGSPGDAPGRFPMTDVFELPFLVPYLAKDKTGKLIRDTLYEKYLIPLQFGEIKVLWTGQHPPVVLQLVNKPVRTLEDLKGLVIGFPGGKVYPALLSALGATPELVRTPDMYTALERKMIGGIMLAMETQLNFKFYEVTKYVTMMNTSATTDLVFMNKESWEGLPPDIKKIFDELAPWVVEKETEAGNRTTEAAIKVAKDNGVEIINLSPQEYERWVEATKGIIEDWIAEVEAKGLPARKMVNEVRQLQAE